jgi:hypothetical protein
MHSQRAVANTRCVWILLQAISQHLDLAKAAAAAAIAQEAALYSQVTNAQVGMLQLA